MLIIYPYGVVVVVAVNVAEITTSVEVVIEVGYVFLIFFI
jgi:hypothetical protein